MKTIGTIILAIFLACNLAAAQDTMYVYRAGAVISKQAVADVDSVIFYKPITPPPTVVTDIDGNVYTTVTIGTQVWMVENLKTTKYNDGTSIPLVSFNATWSILTTPAYCWYNNDAANKNTYGALYNFYTVNTNKLAPTGWHVPSDAEWTTLENYLIANGYNYDGTTSGNKIAKSLASAAGWTGSYNEGAVGSTDNTSIRNKSGFTALPGGFRNYDGTFNNSGVYGHWWGSTQSGAYSAWYRCLYYAYSYLVTDDGPHKQYGFSVRCVKDVGVAIVMPTLSATVAPTNITTTSAISGGNISSDGGAAITGIGVCWNTTGSPTIADSKTSDTARIGGFTSTLTGLIASTLYHVRAYATNSVGTAYGAEVSFTTEIIPVETVTDMDGNVYHTVTIGTQTWMVENLKTTKYNDGTSIPTTTNGTDWASLTTPGYCFYNNDAANKNIYGALYNWYTVNTGKLAPTGWHVPTDAEWTTLENYLIANGYNYDGTTTDNKIAKSLAATTGWYTSTYTGAIGNDLTKNNTSGFAGLPGGYRDYSGAFDEVGDGGNWWSSSEYSAGAAWFRDLYANYGYVGRPNYYKQCGFSVRCIMDPLTVYTTSVSNITTNSAICGGKIVTLVSAPVTERGLCYSTSQNPTTSNSKIVIGSGTGTFSGTVSGLTANTTYYLRAYAINNSGTVYGNENAFKTFTGSVTDIDGNIYNTVTIGTQVWMAENLKTTKYNDGTVIPNATDSMTWANSVNDSYCWYDYDIANRDAYGALYNWHCVGTSKLAPQGWHVAYDEEWTEMENYLIANGYNFDGTTTGNKIAKSLASTTLWQRNQRSDTIIGAIANNLAANNSSGFSAIPGGCLYERFNNGGLNGGYVANWWTASAQNTSDAWSRDLYYHSTGTFRYYDSQKYGKSVRCVRYTGNSPRVITDFPSSITTTSAILGGNVVYDGGSAVVAKGVCWSTSPGPTIALSTKTNAGSGSGPFVSTITGLATATTYYVRAYVSNGSTTTYGSEQQFKTKNDYDGKYTNTGTMTDAVNPALTAAYPLLVDLITQDGTSVAYFDVEIWVDYFHTIKNGTSWSGYASFAPIFKFDASNNVISVTNYYGQPAPNGRKAELDITSPGVINKYDPATKTLKVTYWMIQNDTYRTHFDETFTYVGPR